MKCLFTIRIYTKSILRLSFSELNKRLSYYYYLLSEFLRAINIAAAQSRVQVRGSKPGEIVVSRSVMFYTINLVKRTREAPDPLKTHPVKKSYGGTKIIIYNQSFSTFT